VGRQWFSAVGSRHFQGLSILHAALVFIEKPLPSVLWHVVCPSGEAFVRAARRLGGLQFAKALADVALLARTEFCGEQSGVLRTPASSKPVTPIVAQGSQRLSAKRDNLSSCGHDATCASRTAAHMAANEIIPQKTAGPRRSRYQTLWPSNLASHD